MMYYFNGIVQEGDAIEVIHHDQDLNSHVEWVGPPLGRRACDVGMVSTRTPLISTCAA